MKIAGNYKVVDGPTHSGSAPFHIDEFYLYGVRDIYKGGPVFYFECPFPNLPEKFWVRMVTAAYSYYEFVSCDDKEAMERHHPRVHGLPLVPGVYGICAAH